MAFQASVRQQPFKFCRFGGFPHGFCFGDIAAIDEVRRDLALVRPLLADAAALAPNAAALEMDRLLFAVTAGNGPAVDREFERQLRAGTDPNQILALLRTHPSKFMNVGVAVSEGAPLKAAVDGLRPPVFWKVRDAFTAQVRDWPLDRSLKALDRVKDTLTSIRQTGAPTHALARQCLFDIARLRG